MGVTPEIKDSNVVFMSQQKILGLVQDILDNQLKRLREKVGKKMNIEELQ